MVTKFKKGDKIKEKRKNAFGLKGKVGIVTKVSNKPFFHITAKFPKEKGTFEFHKGELTKVRKKRK